MGFYISKALKASSLTYLQHTVIPLQQLVSFGMNLVSRSFEFQVTILFFSFSIFDGVKMDVLKMTIKFSCHSIQLHCPFLFQPKPSMDLSLMQSHFPSPFDFVYLYHPMQADAFAKKLGYSSSLRAGLVRLQVTFQNLRFASFSWFSAVITLFTVLCFRRRICQL